ncbi:MAG: DUF1501 domain-containing protein [Pirellulaceae bacterium]|nr:DUF1501 domain-containing protein [Pirellulaceae bacterium]
MSFFQIDRRGVLKLGALSVYSKTLSASLNSATTSHQPNTSNSKSCIFILLQGGPSHLDLWDPKPHSSREIRGPFQTITTSSPDMQFGELLQESAKIANDLTVIRSVRHNFNNHIAGTYITLTGSENQPNQDREAHADDFPSPGAIVNHLAGTPPQVPRSISLPTWLSIPGPSNRMPGQYSGFLGSVNDPFLIKGDPNSKNYNPLSLSMVKDMSSMRFSARMSLKKQLDSAAGLLEKSLQKQHDSLLQSAYDMVTDGRVRKALDISRESSRIRDQYGRNKYGQSLLVARRLVEAGVQLVSYNAFNQQWDTHGGLEGRYRQLVPEMDRGFAALVGDLKDREMLDQTMVVNTGEFGRTPVINKQAGRDHWPNVYSTVMAGGAIRQGFIYGKSDNKGAEVAENAVAPADVLATMWRHLGVDPHAEIFDRLHRPYPISSGRVISEILK